MTELKKEYADAVANYVAPLCAECPQFAPDPQQSAFFGVLDNLRKGAEWDELASIPMSGFPASAVDVEWLKAKAQKVTEDLYQDFGPHYILPVIDHLLTRCVQRLKTLELTSSDEGTAIEVFFVTKDDNGYYEYRFNVSFDAVTKE